MRDRRNTHLSTSSTSSTSSADSTQPSTSGKDIERLASDGQDSRPTRKSSPYLFYRITTTICILLYVVSSLWRDEALTGDGSLPWRSTGIIAESTPSTLDHAGGHSFVDNAGRYRWTIHIPSNHTSQLSDYHHICRDAKRLRQRPSPLHRLWPSTSQALSHDPTYMDVDEEQALSPLPGDRAALPTDTCRTSLTFIMGDEASFGKTLLLLWLSYGFAKLEGRAFFLDDSRWAYGRYDTYFAPLPRPGCTPPPSSHIVPCPLQAKHVVVTASTASLTLDETVNDIFRRQISTGPSTFDLIRAGYDATFRLIGEDAAYAQERIQQLRASAAEHDHPLIGMHIRRGDLHPFELQFSQDYLPVERFTDAARGLLGVADAAAVAKSFVLASDDPDLIESAELTVAASPHTLHKTQERIQLATKLALDRTSPVSPIRQPGSAYVKHVDENAGWDGGFYTALFYSSGESRSRVQRQVQKSPTKETMRMREMIGRGYLLDLAVLSQTDGVVCAVSSAACRVLGVMMGREAVEAGSWLNVDDHRAWSWQGRKY